MKFGLRILAGAVLLFVGFRIAKWVARHIRTRQGKRASKVPDPLSPTMRSFLASAVGIGLRILIVILFIILMGANTSSVVAMLSSAALAIGLALQNSFSNLAGGLLIILFKPFGLGDYITVNGEAGTVQDINIYFTSMLTPDNRTVVFPNGVMSNSRWSIRPRRKRGAQRCSCRWPMRQTPASCASCWSRQPLPMSGCCRTRRRRPH